ncbi:MAG: hypothetical protein R2710_05510 [Acidimicrobiales bacterium]
MDPRTPVLIGAAQVVATAARGRAGEFMTRVAEAALADTAHRRSRADPVHPAWSAGSRPYRRPWVAVAERLSLPVEGGGLGSSPVPIDATRPSVGNEVYDLIAHRGVADIRRRPRDVP